MNTGTVQTFVVMFAKERRSKYLFSQRVYLNQGETRRFC